MWAPSTSGQNSIDAAWRGISRRGELLVLMNAVFGQEGLEFALQIHLKRLAGCGFPVDVNTHRYRRAIPRAGKHRIVFE